jgi:hypothetical protein
MTRGFNYYNRLLKKFEFSEILIISLSLIVLNILMFRTDMNLTMSLFWIILLFLSPFYTAPLVAGEWNSGSDSLLFTLPFSDRKTTLYLFFKGFIPLVKITTPIMAGLVPLILIKSEDFGQFAASWSGILLGTALLTASGLCISLMFKKTASAWFFIIIFQGVIFLFPPLLGSSVSSFFSGYLSLSHITLLLSLVFLFLLFTFLLIRRLRGGPFQPAYMLIAEFLFIALLSIFLPGGMDITFRGYNRVNRVTAKKIRNLDDKLFIRWYHTDNLELLFPQSNRMVYLLDSLKIKGLGGVQVSENGGVKSNEVITMGKSRSWAEQTATRGDQFEPLYSALEIEYRGRTETLPLVYDPVIAEEQMLAALQRLTEGYIPEIGIITGRVDRPLDEYWTILTGSLEEYFTIRDYTGRENLLLENQPDALFVLNGRDIDAWAASRIMDYIREGGSVLAALSPLELNPRQSDLIEYGKINPLIEELNQLGITWGESYILDEKGALYLSSGDNSAPARYPLWFRTSQKGLYDYDSLWSVPLYYTGEVLWKVSSSKKSTTAGMLTNISPVSLARSPAEMMTVYDTALALRVEKGTLTVVSGAESLSNLMVLSQTQNYNGAWIQSLAFFLSGNTELTELRKHTLGVR